MAAVVVEVVAVAVAAVAAVVVAVVVVHHDGPRRTVTGATTEVMTGVMIVTMIAMKTESTNHTGELFSP